MKLQIKIEGIQSGKKAAAPVRVRAAFLHTFHVELIKKSFSLLHSEIFLHHISDTLLVIGPCNPICLSLNFRNGIPHRYPKKRIS